MRDNTVLRKLREGKPTVGSWLTLDSSLVAGIMARVGFDWLMIDTEHGTMDYSDMLSAIQAILPTTTTPLVRVAWNDGALIKRALDAGAMGVLIPMVMNGDEARFAVEAVRFPPQGRRSYGGLAVQTFYGEDYFPRANEEILLSVQIEHIEAVQRAEEICEVEGIDLVFIGPNDLASSLGLLGTPFKENTLWQDAVKRILKVGREKGKPMGIHAVSTEEVERYIEQGFLFVALSTDAQILRQACSNLLKSLKGKNGS
ncbi:hypothetical protein H5T87_03735 [bacterium]|nr:hypothetical protein [bacterium]